MAGSGDRGSIVRAGDRSHLAAYQRALFHHDHLGICADDLLFRCFVAAIWWRRRHAHARPVDIARTRSFQPDDVLLPRAGRVPCLSGDDAFADAVAVWSRHPRHPPEPDSDARHRHRAIWLSADVLRHFRCARRLRRSAAGQLGLFRQPCGPVVGALQRARGDDPDRRGQLAMGAAARRGVLHRPATRAGNVDHALAPLLRTGADPHCPVRAQRPGWTDAWEDFAMNVALDVAHLNKNFGAIKGTDDLSLRINEGELHAIIGPNGAGKTTLIAQLSGELRPNSGDIRFFGESIVNLSMPQRVGRGIVRSFQITSLCPEFSALTNVALAVQARAGHSYHFWRDARNDPRFVGPAMAALDRAGLADRATVPAGLLAHGEQRQLELAIALAAEPRLLLLDEPMAGMGSEESQQVIALLGRLKSRYTIVLVEHDMDAVFALADRISVLVYGHCIASGTPEEIRNNPAVYEAYLGEDTINA